MKITKLLCLSILIFAMFTFRQQGGMISAETVSPANSATLNNIRVPIGVQSFKIEVSENGIYEITQPELVAAGMNATAVNPNNFQMMSDGSPVSFEFVGDTDNNFEANEAIRFYGWEFDRSRKDTWFVEENIYWLWEGNAPNRIASANNASNYPVVTEFAETILFEENLFPDFGSSSAGSDFVNGFDFWLWDEFSSDAQSSIPLTINDPASTGTVSIKTELFHHSSNPGKVSLRLNGNDLGESAEVDDNDSIYFTASTPVSTLVNGTNQVELSAESITIGRAAFQLNNIEVTYPRELIAVNDALTFMAETTGAVGFKIDGFSESDAADFIAWDITDRHSPVAISLSAGDISVANPNALTLNVAAQSGNAYHVTAASNIKTVGSISSYTATDQTPAGGAEWLAITHPSFSSQANRLATHRQDFSGLTTHVADWEEIKNQYGYGFSTPSAIQAYLAEAQNWPAAPQYVLIAGNSTLNPSQRECTHPTECRNDWSTEPTFVPTDIQHVDRFLGVLPSDYTYMTATGGLAPVQLHLGRLPANTSTEMRIMVDKIIRYDEALESGESWTLNHISLADDQSRSGNFCDQSQEILALIPEEYLATSYCLDDYFEYDEYGDPTNQEEAKGEIRTDYVNSLNEGAGFSHYFGQGSLVDWGGGIFNEFVIAQIQNENRPTIVWSETAFDGNFAFPETDTLSELIMKLPDNRGSAAYMSQSGTQYSFETVGLKTEMFKSLYAPGVDSMTVGEMVSDGLDQYLTLNLGHESVLYGHVLLGDPAMLAKAPITYRVYAPLLTSP